MKYIAIILTILWLLTHAQAISYRTSDSNDRFLLQKRFVVKDVYDCLRQSSDRLVSSVRGTILSVRNCFRIHILVCLKKTEKVNEAYSNETTINIDNKRYCGIFIINSKMTIQNPDNLHFTVLTGYIMHFHIFYFHFEWSHLGCKSHALAVFTPEFGDVFLCGKRLSSIFIINDYHTSMGIVLTPDLLYSFSLFYSITRRAWLNSPIKVSKLSAYQRFLPQHLFHPTYDSFYQFIVTVNPLQYIIFVTGRNKEMIHATFLDGPGLLSKRLNEVYDNTFITSTFNGVIYLRWLVFSRLDINISISSGYQSKSRMACYNRQQRFSLPLDMMAHTNKDRGIVCFRKFAKYNAFFKFRINYFEHSGPTVLDGDHNCQYGGLFIYRVGPVIRLCSRRADYIIYGENQNITILLVWYPGYSYGQIIGSLEDEPCPTDYVPSNSIFLGKRKVILKGNTYCQRFICPTHFGKQMGYCDIEINGYHQDIGASRIEVALFPSLQPCVRDHNTNVTNYTTSALYSDNWPMSALKISNITNTLSESTTFDFLRRVNISVPNICIIERPLSSFGVILQKSYCHYHPVYQRAQWEFFLNSITITSECLKLSFVIPFDTTTDMFYIVGDKMQTGLDVTTFTKDCPIECNNFTAVLTVIKESKTSVYQYVGHGYLFTGFYQRGFRVTVIPPPNNTCSDQYGCILYLGIDIPQYPIGVTNTTVVHHGNQEWHMFPKR